MLALFLQRETRDRDKDADVYLCDLRALGLELIDLGAPHCLLGVGNIATEHRASAIAQGSSPSLNDAHSRCQAMHVFTVLTHGRMLRHRAETFGGLRFFIGMISCPCPSTILTKLGGEHLLSLFRFRFHCVFLLSFQLSIVSLV